MQERTSHPWPSPKFFADVVKIIDQCHQSWQNLSGGLKLLHKTLAWIIMDIINTAIYKSKYPTAFKYRVIDTVPTQATP